MSKSYSKESMDPSNASSFKGSSSVGNASIDNSSVEDFSSEDSSKEDSYRQRPQTRAARLSLIEQALFTDVITSQSQLSQVLARHGIEVTQATLSRDLDEINAVKIRLHDGRIAYVLGDGTSHGHNVDSLRIEQQVSRILSGLVTQVARANNLLVIHTPSGAAQYVASVIDKQPLKGVLGTIGGDDTVMVICESDEMAKNRADWLIDMASKN